MTAVKEIKFILLIVFSLIAAYTDYRYGKIFNWTNFSLLIIGIIVSFYEHSILSSVAGIVVAFILMFPFFATGGMGAGDVKFAMATGTVVGGKSLLLLLGIAGVIILFYALFNKMGIVKIFVDGVKALWKLIKSGFKRLIITIKLSALSGRVMTTKSSGNNTLKIETHHRIRYGVFLGISNIIFSMYLIFEQGGIK